MLIEICSHAEAMVVKGERVEKLYIENLKYYSLNDRLRPQMNILFKITSKDF